jgi:hypothetical protein
MATARRHYFLVADEVGHAPWSDHQFAMFVRLVGHMHERWARDGLTPEQACKCLLSEGEANRITGRKRVDVCEKSLRSLGVFLSTTVERRGEVWEIIWPRFAEFQRLYSRSGEKLGPPVPVPVPVLKEKSTTYSKRKAEKPQKPRAAKRAPEEFDLTDERLKWATGEGLTVKEAEREFDALCDHEFRAGRSDWEAVWRNWVREYMRRNPVQLKFQRR